jgi:Superfamily II DNA/RNA helicases, SNF2 family
VPTNLLLLLFRSGAVGINLTQANRVFLMEPAMNPALEAQAIGRIYRLGQRKSVQVIKFVVQNSFESRLVKILKRKYGQATKPTPTNSDQVPDNSNQVTKESCPEANVDRSGVLGT